MAQLQFAFVFTKKKINNRQFNSTRFYTLVLYFMMEVTMLINSIDIPNNVILDVLNNSKAHEKELLYVGTLKKKMINLY